MGRSIQRFEVSSLLKTEELLLRCNVAQQREGLALRLRLGTPRSMFRMKAVFLQCNENLIAICLA
jgi:hypothetical protein